MKFTITGSLGNISKPLTEELIQKGHSVKVISSNPGKQKDIEALGADAAIGSIEDIKFLTDSFTGADAVYCMIPLNSKEADPGSYFRRISKNYVQAIQQTGIKRAVVLSGWAADLVSGENAEGIFNKLTNVSITIMRPASFYTNFYSSIDMIRGKGLIGALLTLRYYGLIALLTGKRGLLMGNYGGDDRTVFVSPLDIADAVAE
jgi:uncharacterized protein YbjT (DUF2867 family)